MIVTSDYALDRVPAPNLPLAPGQYDSRYQEQFNNVLRLYFNRIDALLAQLKISYGDSGVLLPYASIQRTTNKTFTANTATLVTLDQNDYINECVNTGTDGIAVSVSGIYNYQFSVQWANTDTQIRQSWIWLRVNGVDVPGTASRFDVPSKHGTSDGYLIAACNFYVQLTAGQHVDLYAAVDSTALYMEAYPAQTTPWAMPSVPSVVATLTFVSSIPA